MARLDAIADALTGLKPLPAAVQALAGRLEEVVSRVPDANQGAPEPTALMPDQDGGPKQARRRSPRRAATTSMLQPTSGANASENGDDAFDRDPGDAVPPGVAVPSPAPLSKDDKKALDALANLPKRRRRGRQG